MGIPDGAGQPVQLGNDDGVTFSARCQRFTKAWAVRVAAGQSVVDVDSGELDAEGQKCIPLCCEVLLVCGNPGVADPYCRHEWQCLISHPVPGQLTGPGLRDAPGAGAATEQVTAGFARYGTGLRDDLCRR